MDSNKPNEELLQDIQSQIDAGFSEIEIYANLTNKGYREEEIKAFLNPAAAIDSKDKQPLLRKVFILWVVVPVIGLALLLLLYFLLAPSNVDNSTGKIIGGVLAISLLTIPVGFYKFLTLYFSMYEVSNNKRIIIWIAIIAILIAIGKWIDL